MRKSSSWLVLLGTLVRKHNGLQGTQNSTLNSLNKWQSFSAHNKKAQSTVCHWIRRSWICAATLESHVSYLWPYLEQEYCHLWVEVCAYPLRIREMGTSEQFFSFPFFFPSKEQVLLSVSQASYVVTDDLQLPIPLPACSKCWDYRCELQCWHYLRCWGSNLELHLYQLSCTTSPELLGLCLDPQARERKLS